MKKSRKQYKKWEKVNANCNPNIAEVSRCLLNCDQKLNETPTKHANINKKLNQF